MLYHAQNITVEVQDTLSPAVWHALGSANLQQYEVNHTAVQVNEIAESPWRRLLDGAGERSIRLSVRAYVEDGEACAALNAAGLTREARVMRLTLADGAQLEGSFMVQRLQRGGAADGLEEMTIRLESAGEITVGNA